VSLVIYDDDEKPLFVINDLSGDSDRDKTSVLAAFTVAFNQCV
jgi:hypothetical protein